MKIVIEDVPLEDLVEQDDFDEIVRAFGHLANALEQLGGFPNEYL